VLGENFQYSPLRPREPSVALRHSPIGKVIDVYDFHQQLIIHNYINNYFLMKFQAKRMEKVCCIKGVSIKAKENNKILAASL
jgi:hypothetical protein